MARPLRLEFAGALYHVTSRGNERRPTFYDDHDRLVFLQFLGEAVRRFGWIVTAYVLSRETSLNRLRSVESGSRPPLPRLIFVDPSRRQKL